MPRQPLCSILRLLLLGLLAASYSTAQDLTEPRLPPGPSSVGAISEITIATNSLEETKLLYEQALGLTAKRQSNAINLAKQKRLWQCPSCPDWREWRLQRDGLANAEPAAPQLRVLHFAQSLKAQHQSWNSLELGPMAIGFPNTIAEDLDQKLRRLGFGAQSTLNRYQVPAADGSSYEMKETIFNGPDFVKAVLVQRGNGLALGPIDPASQIGGPAYLSMVVPNSAEMASFLTKVLDYELRSDRVFTTSGALGAPIGTQYRFMIFYSKGARFGHLLLLEYKTAKAIDTKLAPRLPQRGVVLLSMYTKDLKAVLQRAQQAKIPASKVMRLCESKNCYRAASLIAPNGLMFEIRQRIDD